MQRRLASRLTGACASPLCGARARVFCSKSDECEYEAFGNFWETAKSSRRGLMAPERGMDLLNNAIFNKGTAFPDHERTMLGIRGLLPPRVIDIDVQIARIMHNYAQLETPLQKFVFLQGLQDRNETLFYRILMDNIEEMAPIVYTPTVGTACQTFSMIFNRSRGMYFSLQDVGQMVSMVHNWPLKRVDVIVVTDGSRILGLGDLGVNGAGIPIGKLSLYVGAGGIRPYRVMPVTLDVGTNNQALLDDPFYLGLKHPRVSGKRYVDFMDEFIYAVVQRWPQALVQFEDFSNDHASFLLERYRNEILTFNDDIQGTGCVALAGVYNAVRASQGKDALLKDQRIVVVGAGSAGLGVSFNLRERMEYEGCSQAEAYNHFYLVDKQGLLGKERTSLQDSQVPYARSDLRDGLPLLELVKQVKPTVLLGLSGCGNIFSDEIISEMAKHVERPIIFPLSNPTKNAECTANSAYTLTNGKAIFASGSPFDPVTVNGTTFSPSQGNNMFVFPGLGLGATLCKAKHITNKMLYNAAIRLADSLNDDEREKGMVYPDVKRIREVSLNVACEVIETAMSEGLNQKNVPDGETVRDYVDRKMYRPKYQPFVLESEGAMKI